MLQRIQTIYLLIVTLLVGSMFFYPYAELLGEEKQIYVFNFNGLFLDGIIYHHTVTPVILLSLIVLISFCSIFLYKKRILQMRISFINLLLMLGYIGLNYYYIKSFSNQLSGVISYTIIVVFPLVAAILIYLAIRAIGKDEALVRSLNRIR